MTPLNLSLSSDLAAAQLERFLAGDAVARDRFPRLAQRDLLRMARRFAPSLSQDLLEDVVLEFWVWLLSRRPRFDRRRGSARAFLRPLLRSALWAVRSENAAPGSRKHACEASRVESGGEGGAVEVGEGDGLAAARQMEARADVGRALADAPMAVAGGLWLMGAEGLTLGEAATRLQVSRYTLSRALNRFAAAKVA